MSRAARSGLRRFGRPDFRTNAGLWLDRYLDSFSERQGKGDLVKEVAAIPTPDPYASSYKRWCGTLAALGAETRTAMVAGRMVVGVGDESILETSVTLHHTYGVPYIPGSALKGLAASFARQRLDDDEWNQNGTAYQTVFGNTDVAGYVTFFDALYQPGSGQKGQALHSDVLTVHHKEYYEGKGVPPADWDDPVPLPLLSATGCYLLALAGPPAWVEATFKILKLALAETGVGAKTSSGYGRMRFVETKPARKEQKPVALPKQVDEIRNEDVILESDVRDTRRAQVQVSTGEIVTCTDFQSSAYGRPVKGGTCRAAVTYREGHAIGAKWLPRR